MQKHINATQLCFAERALLPTQNQFLTQINNESKARRWTKAGVVGTAKVMAWEDLDKVRAERAAKDEEKEAKRVEKEAKRVEKETKRAEKEAKRAEKEVKRSEKEVKKAEKEAKKAANYRTRGQKRKMTPAIADTPRIRNKSPRMGAASNSRQAAWLGEEQRVAPVARMI